MDDEYEIVDIGARYENGEDVIVFSIIQVQEGGMIDAFYEMNEESLRTETVGTPGSAFLFQQRAQQRGME